jgi:hypothetical protein
VAGIQAVGFIEKDDKGNLVPTGKRGCQGFVEWLALNEPKTAAALFARVLPYFVNVGGEVPEVVSEAEMEAMLKELGLPVSHKCRGLCAGSVSGGSRLPEGSSPLWRPAEG